MAYVSMLSSDSQAATKLSPASKKGLPYKRNEIHSGTPKKSTSITLHNLNVIRVTST
jgi:hypothetical protein